MCFPTQNFFLPKRRFVKPGPIVSTRVGSAKLPVRELLLCVRSSNECDLHKLSNREATQRSHSSSPPAHLVQHRHPKKAPAGAVRGLHIEAGGCCGGVAFVRVLGLKAHAQELGVGDARLVYAESQATLPSRKHRAHDFLGLDHVSKEREVVHRPRELARHHLLRAVRWRAGLGIARELGGSAQHGGRNARISA